MKVNKEKAGCLFVIVFLTVALGVSIYFGISGWYFYSETNYVTDLSLGKTVQANIKGNQANAVFFNLEGSYLPNSKLPQVISVNNISESPLFIRAKCCILSSANSTSPLELSLNSNWEYRQEDGYYYYNNNLEMQSKTTLCDFIIMPSDLFIQSNKKYIVSVVFESLNGSQDATVLWGYNPLGNK
ncbi:MAG: hypothetical protein E7379_01100 [Clostridiales bacterium]|nr:hypothetical protein [Clostridiales bacterium]